jgi:hypothetical protein
MKAYKFLRPGRIAPFSEFAWPEQTWVKASREPETCRSGIHACRLGRIAYWLADELWVVELDGKIEEEELQVIAARGRLLGRVDAWDERARSEFALECVRRAAFYAAAELREHGIGAEADRLSDASELEELAKRATEACDAAGEVLGAGEAVQLAGFVADAADYARHGLTPGAAFVAAHAAVVHAPPGVDDPFGAEREEQARWLAARLSLTEGAG